MKKVLLICLLIAGTTLYAQPPRGGERGHRGDKNELMKDLSPQQRAELKTKRMVLALDLSKAQQAEIMKLNLEIAQKLEKNKPDRENKKELSANEMFTKASAHLDEKIATKKRLKQILTKEQFEKFERSHHERGKEMRRSMRGKKRK